MVMTIDTDVDLHHHGDREASPGLLDFAVNVRRDQPPRWLREVIAASLADLGRYPDDSAARTAVATRHARAAEDVLLTAGASEAFVLIARTLRPRHAVVVHPQFTEPEAALRAAGHPVERVILTPESGFALKPTMIASDADLVVIGNPTNPTSVLHPAATLEALIQPGRTLVIDEAFMDAVPAERESLVAHLRPGVLVVRSLTKTWGLAGLRIGYVVGDPALIDALRTAQPLWPVSTPALAAAEVCSSAEAVRLGEADAVALGVDRDHLVAQLAEIGIEIAGRPQAPFVLARFTDGERVRLNLRQNGIAVRRGDTFPGLGPDWLRIAVRSKDLIDRLVREIDHLKQTN
jgi:histidinol-phosphate aminotransferase